ncbi:MAG: chemotaxis protein CheX [Planctomycetota bacterium]|nr:chemotaxis protein CheX [Planctomycetota bacterium]MCX8039274.1 chemotaxis protein CheX [Planctomycetota bacterium]MDW8372039.1 chemotaxis protein CheX [Planctomycetota bacterium]
MSVTAEDLERIASEVWRDVLAEELAPAAAVEDVALTACVQITGAFRGAVVLSAALPVAVGAAARMFAIARDEVGEADARDALGELANMVAGHVKTLVAGPSQLALPSVLAGSEHGLRRCRLELLAECRLRGADGGFSIRVYEDCSDP